LPLANATFVVENKTGEVASFTTDDQGRFRTSLLPGHYKVSLREGNSASAASARSKLMSSPKK